MLMTSGLPGIVGPFQDVKRIFEAIPNARLVDGARKWVYFGMLR
jgi:hypothetical protein